MALENKIIVRFEPQGDKALITAINHLNVATKGLKTNSSAYEKALGGLTGAQKTQVDSMLQMNHAARQTSGSFSVLRSQMLLMSFAAMIVVGTALKAAKMFGEQEMAIKKLDFHVSGTTLKNLEKFAAEQQKLTTFGDELTLGIMNEIAARGASEKTIKQATKLAMDLSAVTGDDLKTSMDKVTKTLYTQRSAFRDSPLVSGAANMQIQSAGSATEKLAILMGELNPAIEGASEALADTFLGSLDQTGNALGDVVEIIGEGLVPIINAITVVLRIFAGVLGFLKPIIVPLIIVIGTMVAGLGIYKIAIIVAKIATTQFNAALLLLRANPVIAWISLLVAIIMACVWVYKKLTGATDDQTKATNEETGSTKQITESRYKHYAIMKKLQVAVSQEGLKATKRHKITLMQKLQQNAESRHLRKSQKAEYESSRHLWIERDRLRLSAMQITIAEHDLFKDELLLKQALNMVAVETTLLQEDWTNKEKKVILLLQEEADMQELLADHLLNADERGQQELKLKRLQLKIEKGRQAVVKEGMKNDESYAISQIKLAGAFENQIPVLTKLAIIEQKKIANLIERDLATTDLEKSEKEHNAIVAEEIILNRQLDMTNMKIADSTEASNQRKTRAKRSWWNQYSAIESAKEQIDLKRTQLEAMNDAKLIANHEEYLSKVAALDAEEAELDQQKWNQKFSNVQKYIGALQNLGNSLQALFDAEQSRLEKDIEDNRKEELENVKNIRSKKAKARAEKAINDKYDLEQEERAADAENSRKALKGFKYASAVSNVALGITQTWADPELPTWGKIALTAIQATAGMLQIATINAAEYAKGGLIGGNLHSQGGNLINAERGEFVMSRNAVDSIGVEAMNRINRGQSSGSVNITFSGNVMSSEWIEEEAIPKIRDAVRRGANIGVG